jgi:hypothetical protein
MREVGGVGIKLAKIFGDPQTLVFDRLTMRVWGVAPLLAAGE